MVIVTPLHVARFGGGVRGGGVALTPQPIETPTGVTKAVPATGTRALPLATRSLTAVQTSGRLGAPALNATFKVTHKCDGT